MLNLETQQRVDLLKEREVRSFEGGVKTQLGRVAFTVNGFFTELKKVTGQGARTDPATGGTIWVIEESPDNRSYGAELEAIVTPTPGLQLQGSATFLRAELGGGVDTLENLKGERLAVVPNHLGNLAATFSPPAFSDFQVRADWHWVGARLTEGPLTRVDDTELPAYNYFNFGASLAVPAASVRLNVDLVNAFQSKGLEEGNPRLVSVGGAPIFLARPLLPRRLLVGLTYDFGGGGGSTLEAAPGQ
jgi:outer membrane receptor protein involved in Fe transport